MIPSRGRLPVFAVIAVFAVVSIHSDGFGQRTDTLDTPRAGRWRKLVDGAVTGQQSKVRSEEAEKLLSLPYLQGYHKAPSRSGVTVHDKKTAWEGVTFLSSGHAAEAQIIDMEGRTLHTWSYDVSRIWPGVQVVESSTFWRRAHLFPNGDILAIYNRIGMIKLDRDSNLLWSFKARETHHHMQVDGLGNIYVLTVKKELIPEINGSEKVLVDYLTILDPKGQIIDEISLLDAFRNSRYAYMLGQMKTRGELFHTNTIQLFDGSLAGLSPFFRKGNAMIAPLYLNAIAIVNLDSRKVEWALRGHDHDLWYAMHEPVLMKNGTILLFDNHWDQPRTEKSKVIEFEPFSRKVTWRYDGTARQPFYSEFCGTNQRLPNVNTLITETDRGRIFEVTEKGGIVWEYVSPYRAGEDNELIATILHAEKFPRAALKWLPE